MPDLVGFTITPLASASVNVPRATIACQIVDSKTRALIHDFTGANAVTFPNVLTTLTAADRLELAQMIATWLLYRVAGIG